MLENEHKPGDKWTHDKWPEGTPPAVGKVEEGVVTWAEPGGSQVPNILARHLVDGAMGWHRVS